MGIYYKSKTGSIQFLEYAILLLVRISHPWVTKESNFEPFPSVHITFIPSIKKTLPEAQRTQGFARPRLILPKNPDLAPKSTEAVSKESLGDPLAHILHFTVNLSANGVQQTQHFRNHKDNALQ